MAKEKVVVALGGGGSKGSFHLGALDYILEKFDIEGIVGTSIGAMNAYFIAANKMAELKKIWLDKNIQDNILTPWQFGLVEGFIKGSLYKPDGIRKAISSLKVEEVLKTGIQYGCVSTDMINQKKVFTKLTESNKNEIIDWITASSAISPAFGPVRINGGVYMDGGYSEGIPVESATSLIKEAKRVIMIACDKSGTDTDNPVVWKDGLINVFMQATSTCIDTIFDYNVKYGQLKYWSKIKDIRFDFIYPETQVLSSAFDFNQSKLMENIRLGFTTASSVLEK